MVASTEILGLIFPSAYADASKALFALAPGMFLLILVAIVTAVLQGSGHPNKPALLIGGSIIVQIVLLYNLVPRYEIVGASISTSVSSALGLIGLMIYYPNNFRLRLHWTNGMRVLGASILTIMILHMFPMTNPIYLLGSIFMSYVIFLTVLVISRYFDSMDKDFFSFILKTSLGIIGLDDKYFPHKLDKLNRKQDNIKK
jgi:O-antigen/teichoic acid export membrane protein